MIKILVLKILGLFDFFYQIKIINYLKEKQFTKLNCFIDIGGHKGESIKLFLKNFSISKIYSFEASPLNFKILKENTQKIKKHYKNTEITLENFALGKDNKKIQMNQSYESSSSTFSNINYKSKYFKKKNMILNFFSKKNFYNKIDTKMITLGTYVIKNKIKKIDFLKIDTEGYEFEVLLGLKNEIKNVNLILFEHHYDDMIIKNYKFSDIHNFLENNNFKKVFKSKMPFRKTFEYIYKSSLFNH
tara:strand:- start:49 stop:783 length:735 start_codon:yes stop_codon:yes gene_type:complete